MLAKPGYYKFSDSSYFIIRCFNYDACLGGNITEALQGNYENGNENECAEGYEGVMCATCSSGYWNNINSYNCYECLGEDA